MKVAVRLVICHAQTIVTKSYTWYKDLHKSVFLQVLHILQNAATLHFQHTLHVQSSTICIHFVELRDHGHDRTIFIVIHRI